MLSTLSSSKATAGVKSIELRWLKTALPVGRGTRGVPGVSPGQRGAGPGQESVITALASGASLAWQSCAASRPAVPPGSRQGSVLGLGQGVLGAFADAIGVGKRISPRGRLEHIAHTGQTVLGLR